MAAAKLIGLRCFDFAANLIAGQALIAQRMRQQIDCV